MPNLTDRSLKALRLKPGQKDRMGVRLTASGSRVFVVQWTDRATRRKRRDPLGVWGAITIEHARTAARARLGEVARGVDPAAERQRLKQRDEADRAETALTLDALITDWAERHLSQRRPRYAKEAQRALRRAFAAHLKKPASRLARATVIEVLDKLASAGRHVMAEQTKAFGRALYGWAMKREQVTSNPFASLPATTEKSSSRDRVLTDGELAEVRAAAESLPYPWAPFYLVALYTLQRREEVAGMMRSELARDLSLWSVPAKRMKNKKVHDVHLSAPARAVLQSIAPIAGSDLVFSTNGRTPVSGFSKAKRMLDAKIVENGAAAAKQSGTKPARLVPWHLHDFRRSGVSRLADLGFDPIVADKLLAHKPARLKGTAAVYQRAEFSKERKAALEAWAAYLTGDRDGATILPFPKTGA